MVWFGSSNMDDRDPETVVIEIKTNWYNDVINLLGEGKAEFFLNSLYAGNEVFGQEVKGNDQGIYEQLLENNIGTVEFDKLKEFMEENYPLVWRGHDTFIGDPNPDFNRFMRKYANNKVWLPLKEKFDGQIKDLKPGNWFIDGDGTIVSHDEYSFNPEEGSEWDNWYVPKGLYEIKYLKDLDIVITDPQAINYLILKL
jgi:hypothetical protein